MSLHDNRAGVRDVTTARVEQAAPELVVVGVDEVGGEEREVVADLQEQGFDAAPYDGHAGPDVGQHLGALIDGRHGQTQITQRG